MPGVRERVRAAVTAVLLVAASGPGVAEEFANILVPSVDSRSRQASARALDAASKILSGFQSRELRQDGAERENFLTASRGLRASAEEMTSILNQAERDPDLQKMLSAPFDVARDIPERDRSAFVFWVRRTGADLNDLRSRKDLYRVFAKDSLNLAALVETVPGKRDRDIFRRVTDDMSLYLRMGSVIANIVR